MNVFGSDCVRDAEIFIFPHYLSKGYRISVRSDEENASKMSVISSKSGLNLLKVTRVLKKYALHKIGKKLSFEKNYILSG